MATTKTKKRKPEIVGAMGRPSEPDKSGAHVLTAREIAEFRRKKKASKKK